MRGWAIVLAALLVVPVGAALQLRDPRLTPLLPADLSDGDLLLLLGAHQGWVVERPEPVVVPAGMTLAMGVHMLSLRTGSPLSAEELRAFDDLDPRVGAAVLPLLVAVDEAWTLRDQAFVGVAEDEAPDLPTLIRAAILVSDTLEGVVLPQVDALAQAGVWPASPVTDPVGVLRLGGTGDDVEDRARMIQIDPRGNDEYYNNAGGTTLLTNRVPPEANETFAIAVSLDLAGDDVYDSLKFRQPTFAFDVSQGKGDQGVGLLVDVGGDDAYSCRNECQGTGGRGVGFLRDVQGNDRFSCNVSCQGYASDGLGILRDDAGDDVYRPKASALGVGGFAPGLALFWERGGVDISLATEPYSSFYGVTEQPDGAEAIFVDEGTQTDTYTPTASHAHNNAAWRRGSSFDVGQPNGQGNDNAGGLGFALSVHWP